MKDFYTITTKVASGLVEIITKMDEYLWISSAWWVEAICDYLRRKKKSLREGDLETEAANLGGVVLVMVLEH